MQHTIDDDRFKKINELKKDIIDNTNIECNFDEMNVIDNICFSLWQLGFCDLKDELEQVKKENKELNVYKDKYNDINQIFHKNEPMEAYDINDNHLQELYDFNRRLVFKVKGGK